jgi:hypothetical protein
MCQFLSAIMDVFSDLAIAIIPGPTPVRVRRTQHHAAVAYNQGSGMKTLRLMEAGRLG